jgi:hypothetical protein
VRISSDPDDASYHHAFSTCTFFLAGAARSNVTMADEEHRKAVTVRLDEFGKPVLKAGKVQHDVFWGDVRIEAPYWVRAQCEKPASETECD